jgi:hypothetical protein
VAIIGPFSVLDVELPLWILGMVSAVFVLSWLLQKDTPVRRLWARLAPFPLPSIEEIKPIEKILRWSWSAVRAKRLILFAPLTAGLLIGVSCGVFCTVHGLLERLLVGLLSGLVGVLFTGIVPGIVAMYTGFTWGEIEPYSSPNEGIKRSGRNGLIIGLFFWLWALGTGFSTRQGSSMLPVMCFGLYLGLAAGGEACLYHLALRLVLWHNNFAPLNYIRFLDYAATRIFLRKVGGGYVFVHRMLLEYFAALHQTSTEQ